MTLDPLLVDPAGAFPLYRRFVPFGGGTFPGLRPAGVDPTNPDRQIPAWEDRDAIGCQMASIGGFHAANGRTEQAMEFLAVALREVLDGIYDADQEAARTPRMHTIAAAANYNQAIVCFRLGGEAAHLGRGYASSARSHLVAAGKEFVADELRVSVDGPLIELERAVG